MNSSERHPLGWATLWVASMASLLLSGTAEVRAQQHVLKIASLAPEGSSWISTLRAIDAEVREQTADAVRFKIYPGGVQGDEDVVIRKMRIGQLHGGGFAGTGLSQLFPDVLALETPFTFRDYDEVDYVLAEMERGYALMSWSDIGFVYLLSKRPVRSRDDLAGMKVWRLQKDPVTGVIFDKAGVDSVPLTIPDVLLGLQTNLVEVVYASPVAAIIMQWFTRVKYVTQLPVAYAIGAFLLDQRALDRLSPEHQRIVREVSRRHMGRQRQASRADNADAMQVMSDHGLEFVTLPDDEIDRFRMLVDESLPELVGKAFSKEAFDAVGRHLASYRALNAGASP